MVGKRRERARAVSRHGCFRRQRPRLLLRETGVRCGGGVRWAGLGSGAGLKSNSYSS